LSGSNRAFCKKQKTSAAETVRKAIDAFNPDAVADMAETEPLELVRVRVKQAVARTPGRPGSGSWRR
jgi:hypothetical protein